MSAALLVLTTWSLLAAGGLLRASLGLPRAQALTFGLATVLVWSARNPMRCTGASNARCLPWALAPGPAGVAVGYAAQPAFVAVTIGIGQLLALAPTSETPPSCSDPVVLVGSVVLAPLFEEPLYRGCLFEALRRRWGVGSALIGSSAAFAVPHTHPWTMLATFCVGIALACVAHRTGSIPLCMGLHAGLNLASAWEGIPEAASLATQRGRISCGAGALVALACFVRRRP